MLDNFPIVIIGAGPVGLAAAVHVLQRGQTPLVLEAGPAVGSGPRKWGHIRMFSPWEFNIDPVAGMLLARHGWTAPDPQALPTGRELVEKYLEPLAALPQLAPHIRLGARVTGISRENRDRMTDARRSEVPFVVRYVRGKQESEVLAQAVIDASGTLGSPNPAGSAGLPSIGEYACRERIYYGMPDLLGAERKRYAGRRLLVLGAGHSAVGTLLDAVRLREKAKGTQIHWALRQPDLRKVLGGGERDQLVERGRLGVEILELVEQGSFTVHLGFNLDHLHLGASGLVAADDQRELPPVDELVVATGYRPDFSLLSEIRLALDPSIQCPFRLAPLIDPNQHSCGTVLPHGAEELRHPEERFYLVGMKSYGRAPTFLMRTGYEQVRSVAAALAGDWASARRVELTLPETGVCSVSFDADQGPASECCGGPAKSSSSACCAADEKANGAGRQTGQAVVGTIGKRSTKAATG
jgi:hypothetical protein